MDCSSVTEDQRIALAEVRALLATCRERIGENSETTLALLVRAVERLANAIEPGGEPEAPGDDGEPGPLAPLKFDRARPRRGYNRGE
jgi:hypothetical protein